MQRWVRTKQQSNRLQDYEPLDENQSFLLRPYLFERVRVHFPLSEYVRAYGSLNGRFHTRLPGDICRCLEPS